MPLLPVASNVVYAYRKQLDGFALPVAIDCIQSFGNCSHYATVPLEQFEVLAGTEVAVPGFAVVSRGKGPPPKLLVK